MGTLEASAPGDEMSSSGVDASLSASNAAKDKGGGDTDSVRSNSVQKLSNAVCRRSGRKAWIARTRWNGDTPRSSGMSFSASNDAAKRCHLDWLSSSNDVSRCGRFSLRRRKAA